MELLNNTQVTKKMPVEISRSAKQRQEVLPFQLGTEVMLVAEE